MPSRSNSLLLIAVSLCLASATSFADPEPSVPAPAAPVTVEPVAVEPVAVEPAVTVTAAPATEAEAQTEPAPVSPPAEAPPASVPAAALTQSTTPTAVVLVKSDGVTYYRYPLTVPAGETAPELKTWLVQRAPDAVARLAPDASSILTRRDRRNEQGEIVQQLILVKPGDPATIETRLALDTAAVAEARGWTNHRLRSVSGLQWPLREGDPRVLLRLTYEEKTEAKPAPTQEVLGWYDLKNRTFNPVWYEPRLLGVELSSGGSFLHVLALRPQGDGVQSGEGGDATALLLDSEGRELPAKVLRALRTVGYLYRGWIDDTHLLLKRAGQNQLVVYDASEDAVAVPKGLDNAWTAGLAPNGRMALIWQSEESVDAILPQPIDTTTGAPLQWDTKNWGEAPLAIAGWSADSRYLLLLGKRNPRGHFGRVLLIGTDPYKVTEIQLPADTTISAARFVYEPVEK